MTWRAFDRRTSTDTRGTAMSRVVAWAGDTISGMLRVSVRKVRPEKLSMLVDWLAEIDGPRRAEALATLVDEGCRHETALLIDGPDGPIVIYVMEVENEEDSRAAAAQSVHPVDADHKRVMSEALAERVPAQVLVDLRP